MSYPPVPEGFIVPAGWALVPLEPDWEVIKAAEDEFDRYLLDHLTYRQGKSEFISKHLKENPPQFPIPTWPQENKDWPLPSRLIWNKIVEETKFNP